MTDDEAAKILRIAENHADSYRRAVTQFDDPDKIDQANVAAIAASNTAWFILDAFGYSTDDMRRLRDTR